MNAVPGSRAGPRPGRSGPNFSGSPTMTNILWQTLQGETDPDNKAFRVTAALEHLHPDKTPDRYV